MFNKNVTVKDQATYDEWMTRFNRLEKVKDLTGEKIMYARNKNLMHLRRFANANSAESRIPEDESYRMFRKDASKLQNSFLVDGKVDFKNPDYVDKFTSIQEKHKEAIEERELDIKIYNDFIMEIVPEVESPKIHTTINDNKEPLTQDQFDGVWWFLTE